MTDSDLNDDVGQAGPVFEVPVERGSIRFFAQAMQSEAAAYDGPDAVVPPTFLASATRWAPPGARMPHRFERARLLHGEQEFVFHTAPPRAGQLLFARERVAERYEKPGKRGGTMRFVVLVVEFRDAADVLVAESRSTLIERAKPSPDAKPAAARTEAEPSAPPVSAAAAKPSAPPAPAGPSSTVPASVSAATSPFAVGTKAPDRDFGPMTTQMFVRYSGASGDLNPMHYDADFARAAGYPSVMSQGLHQAALLATFASDWLGPENVRRFLVRFRDQVWPGDVLTCSGDVVAIRPAPSDPDRLLATVQLSCARPNGVVAITGEADFLLPI